jgi:hypothetical protein
MFSLYAKVEQVWTDALERVEQSTDVKRSFGLRLASGESGAEGGEERLANRSRSATPAAEPQTEA